MKVFKKIMALAIAMVMVLSMSISVFAAPTTTTLNVDPVDGHTYKAFQLFVGDLAEDGVTLSNVKWGADAASSISYKTKDNTGAFTVDAAASTTKGEAVPQAVLEYVASLAGKTATDDAQATANIISAWVTGNGTEITKDSDNNVVTGYYVIKDEYTNPTDRQTTTLSTVVCEVVGPIKVTPKAGQTTHDKDVLDVNDSEATLNFDGLKDVDDSAWDKTADHDFGDKVPFRLTTTIGSDFAKYDEYFLSVHDTLGAGLALDKDSIEVYVDGKLAEEGKADDGAYEVVVDGQSFEVKFANLTANKNAEAGVDVVIYYTATIDEDGTDVVIGNDGNPNTSYAEFSNNPNGDQDGTGKTPDKTVVVFTYKMDVDKIAKNAAGTAYEAKSGAGFTLYKQYAAAVDGATNAAADLGKAATQFWYAVGDEVTGVTNFEFAGLDDGNYILVETTTPDGYNTMANLEFTISATIAASQTADHGYAITELSGPTGFAASANGGEFTFTRAKADGSGDETISTKIDGTTDKLDSGEIFGQIINEKGATLPSTGGMGTTIFYVIGAILVLGAAIVLIARRKVQR